MPLVVQPQLGCDTESPIPYSASSKPKRSFDVSSRVALSIGTAVAYSNDPRPIRLAGSTYDDTYNQTEKLVCELVGIAKTGPDAYLYCESTSLAFSSVPLSSSSSSPTANREITQGLCSHYKQQLREGKHPKLIQKKHCFSRPHSE